MSTFFQSYNEQHITALKKVAALNTRISKRYILPVDTSMDELIARGRELHEKHCTPQPKIPFLRRIIRRMK